MMYILAILLTLLVSCHSEAIVSSGYGENPFMDAVVIDAVSSDSVIRFPLITDVHMDKEENKTGVTHFHENLYSWLDGKNYPFILMDGDLADRDYQRESCDAFLYEIGRRCNDAVIYAIGNHEKRVHTADEWEEYYRGKGYNGSNRKRMMRYDYGGILSIYVLDNSERTFGSKQLGYLEEALKRDSNEYKILLCHENITTGTEFDHSLVFFGLSDIAERNEVYRLLSKYNVCMCFTGHHHTGNLFYSHGDGYSEFNAAALHRREGGLFPESKGYWYECIIEDGKLTIQAYDAESILPDDNLKWTMSLR